MSNSRDNKKKPDQQQPIIDFENGVIVKIYKS